MTTFSHQKNIYGLLVFAGSLMLIGIGSSLYGCFIASNVDPKWTPWEQFKIEFYLHVFHTTEAVVGYAIGLKFVSRNSANEPMFHAFKASVLFTAAYLMWVFLVMSSWQKLITIYAPSPIDGFWSVFDDALGFFNIYIFCPALGFLSACTPTKSPSKYLGRVG
jgi:hypothetical protein